MRSIKIFLLCLLIIGETNAHAYGDPGSGTLLFQLLLAASFGMMFYLRRIVAWTRGLWNRHSDVAQPRSEKDSSEGIES
jgi:hypothetical protein